MRWLTCVAIVSALSGCNAGVLVGGEGDEPTRGIGNDAGTKPDAKPGECPAGQHKSGGVCVPDEVTCAAEFPCENGLQCVGGRCVAKPGMCTSHVDCPAGYLCVNGTCQPQCGSNPQCKIDTDCGPSMLCVQCACVPISQCSQPTADLSGPAFNVTQVLHLQEALNDFAKTMSGVLKDLRDGILGCPAGSDSDCWIYQLISSFLPQWSKTLIVAIANFLDLIDGDFKVESLMTFVKNGKPSGYDGEDYWQTVEFKYQNMIVKGKPETIPQINKPVKPTFGASAVCGVLYVDKHKIEGALSGILKWAVDTAVEISTKGQYKSLGDAIEGAISCSGIFDIVALGVCKTLKSSIKNKINDALNKWLLNYSLMTLKGTALVPAGGKQLTNGKWDGTLGNLSGFFKNFTGEWSGVR